MDLTLFIVFVIMILSFIYLINSMKSLQIEVKSLKSTCYNGNSNGNGNLNTNSNSNNIKSNKELINIVDNIKELFLNYIRK